MIFPQRTFKDYQREWASWYSASPNRILNYYNTLAWQSTTAGRFWGNLDAQEFSNVVHMPLAQDICATSANLLFSESPEYDIEEGAAQERIDGFIEEGLFNSTLLEAADMAAGLGGVYMKVDTDPSVSEYPLVTVRSPLSTIPKFKSGHLKAVTFKRLVETEENKKFYLLETRQNDGNRLHITFQFKEYNGTDWNDVGMDSARQDHDITVEDQVLDNVSGLGCVYVPNRLPNRLFLASNEGVSDYQGVTGLLDSLDEVWTSWMRDIELGMARILVDRSMLKDNVGSSDNRSRFDPHQRAFLQMDMDEWRISNNGNGAKPIEQLQFDIRYDEHSKSARDLTQEIVSRCGYAPQSFGLEVGGRAESGTALKMRERKSHVTRQNKSQYWQHRIKKLLTAVQEIDNAARLVNTRYEPQEVDVTLSDSIQEDNLEVSETIRNLDQARAISTKIKVAKANPEWSEGQIDEEVDRILAEDGAIPAEQQGEGFPIGNNN